MIRHILIGEIFSEFKAENADLAGRTDRAGPEKFSPLSDPLQSLQQATRTPTEKHPVSQRTPRMEQIETLLADDPADSFLRYGLAMEHASIGQEETAVALLLELIADTPYVPGFLQAGQILNRLGRTEEGCEVLRRGIIAAKQQGDTHAEGEMSGFLASME
jgi:predicted Zn-dependent protease